MTKTPIFTRPDSSRAAAAFARLVETMAALRSPDGCPWDREQTLKSLVQFVLEETYEVVDAVERDDLQSLREEIGDHIFEGVFLAQIASERGAFDVADAVTYVTDKLVRRHPHVFREDGQLHDADSRERAPSADAALSRWDAQKARERANAGQASSALAGVPRSLPALLRAYKIGKRAASTGFDWANETDVVTKIREEVDELAEVVGWPVAGTARLEEEMGDLLFAIANLSRKLGIEPEAALRRANDKFTARFQAMERLLAASGRRLESMTLEELEDVWTQIKRGGEEGLNAP
jgi:MazG family protein